MWVALLFAGLVSNTGYSITARRTFNRSRIDPIFLAAIMATAVAMPGIPGLFIADINWSVYDFHLIIVFFASVGCAMLYHFVNSKALELTEASVFSIYFNFQIGFATIIGIAVLGEELILSRIIGGVLVFVAGLVLAGKTTARPAGIVFSILTAFLIAALTAFDKYMIDGAGLAEYVFPNKIIVAGALWAVVFLNKRPVDAGFIKSRWCPVLMSFRCMAAYGVMLALSLGAPMSVSIYIFALSCVTTPVAAFLILKERGNLIRKILAVVIALAGVTFIFLAT